MAKKIITHARQAHVHVHVTSSQSLYVTKAAILRRPLKNSQQQKVGSKQIKRRYDS